MSKWRDLFWSPQDSATPEQRAAVEKGMGQGQAIGRARRHQGDVVAFTDGTPRGGHLKVDHNGDLHVEYGDGRTRLIHNGQY